MSHKLAETSATSASPVEKKSRAENIAIFEDTCASILGLRSGKAASHLVTQAVNTPDWCGSQDAADRWVTTQEMLREICPKGATEALLAIQMIAIHNAALMFLTRATVAGQTFEGADANVTRAVRLMRVFNDQLQAMAKLKGTAGRQKVTVEHVHIHQGGQAIVGSVSVGGNRNQQGEPH